MDTLNLAPMITKRKAIRTYTENPLSDEVLEDVFSFAAKATPLFPEFKTVFRILTRKEIACVCPLSAPHYLAIYSERSPDADLNCGFILQQVDLYLSSQGLGVCWLGMARPHESMIDNVPFVILLSFGNSAEAVHRTSIEQFKRKPLAEMSSSGVLPEYIQGMRLAQSAMNKQPWFFSGDARSCRAFSVRGKGLINIAEGWRFVDIGIALANLYVMALSDGRTVSFRREDSIPAGTCSDYVISCRVSE
jgi:hypothetical protein